MTALLHKDVLDVQSVNKVKFRTEQEPIHTSMKQDVTPFPLEPYGTASG